MFCGNVTKKITSVSHKRQPMADGLHKEIVKFLGFLLINIMIFFVAKKIIFLKSS
tara:strand:- start:1723 stop:1887 length:165 start_codon:yes stop_codon:yes gene_type:complete